MWAVSFRNGWIHLFSENRRTPTWRSKVIKERRKKKHTLNFTVKWLYVVSLSWWWWRWRSWSGSVSATALYKVVKLENVREFRHEVRQCEKFLHSFWSSVICWPGAVVGVCFSISTAPASVRADLKRGSTEKSAWNLWISLLTSATSLNSFACSLFTVKASHMCVSLISCWH